MLILASASPRRVALLAQIGVVPDRLAPAEIDEAPRRDELPRALALRLALAKSDTCATNAAADRAYVLAADTVVSAGRRALPKAAIETEARSCLALLSGRRHRVHTAVVLRLPGGVTRTRQVETIVAFARLTNQQIEVYLASGEWRGKAGAYAIQGRAAGFVRFISGSYSNVVGLPLFETAQLLRGLGWLRP